MNNIYERGFKTDADILGLEDEYPARLRGAGNQPLKRPKGFRGSKFGPANPGRQLSPEERMAVEEQMRSDGLI